MSLVTIDDKRKVAELPITQPPVSMSPNMIKAIEGFMKNEGLQIAKGFQSAANAFNNTATVCGGLAVLAKNPSLTGPAILTAISRNCPGLAGLTSTGASAVQTALNQANALLGGGVQGFLGRLMATEGASNASFSTQGVAAGLGILGSFGNMVLGAKNLHDVLTGGVTARFGPGADRTANGRNRANLGLVNTPEAIRAGISAVTENLRRLGTLYDINEPLLLGTPAGLILSLANQNLLEKTGLQAELDKEGIEIDDVELRSPVTLTDILGRIRGEAFQTVIRDTGLVLPSKAIGLTSLADLTQSGNLLTQAAQDNIPDGTLEGLGRQLNNLGATSIGSFERLADVLDSLEIPNLPKLNAKSVPVPAEDLAAYEEVFPVGTGPFGSAQVDDFVGSASGKHTGDLDSILSSGDVIGNTPEGIALQEAIKAHEIDPSEANQAAVVAAIEALAASKNPQVQDALTTSNQLADDVFLKVYNEVQNIAKIGMAIASTVELIAKIPPFLATFYPPNPAGIPSLTEMINGTIKQVKSDLGLLDPSFMTALGAVVAIARAALDLNGGGMAQVFENMADDSEYGEAIRATLIEARNNARLATIGIYPASKVNPEEVWRIMLAETGYGLTTLQKRIIITDATLKGINPKIPLKYNSLYGYNKLYYDQLGYE